MSILIINAHTFRGQRLSKMLAHQHLTVFAAMPEVEGKYAFIANSLRTWAVNNRLNFYIVNLDIEDELSVDLALEAIRLTVKQLDFVLGIGPNQPNYMVTNSLRFCR